MTLRPVSVVDHVLDEYRGYLRTVFQASDPKLRKALKKALDRPLFVTKEHRHQKANQSQTQQ